MELEARQLDQIANIFDNTITKVIQHGKCDRCEQPTESANDLYCKACAIIALRDLAKHLRTYL